LLDGFPLYWVEKPGLKKPRSLEDLAPQDREVCEFFSNLGVVFSTVELIKLEYNPKALKGYIGTFSLFASYITLNLCLWVWGSYASMVLTTEKRKQLAEVALQHRAAPDPSDADASAPADAPPTTTSAPNPSAPTPLDHRLKGTVEATASKDEDTCSGLVFKRKRSADVTAPTDSASDDRTPSWRENPPSNSSLRDIVIHEGGGRAPLEVITPRLMLRICLPSSNNRKGWRAWAKTTCKSM